MQIENVATLEKTVAPLSYPRFRSAPMSFLARSAIIVCVIGATAAVRLVPGDRTIHNVPLARVFAPGPFGREPGETPSPLASSAYLTRAFSMSGPANAEWGRQNALTSSIPFSHNLTTVVPVSLYATHPHFFPLEAGERHQPPPSPYYWNPDIAREDLAAYAASAARRYFYAHPDAVSFSVATNDGLFWGESPELLALATPVQWFRERPDYSRLVFTFTNRVADMVSRTHPNRYIGALAYYWSENPPPFPLHPRVIPFLTADRSQGYDAEFLREDTALKEAWGRLAGRSWEATKARLAITSDLSSGASSGPSVAQALAPELTRSDSGLSTLSSQLSAAESSRRLGIYDYVYGSGFLIPRIHTRLLAEHVRHARAHGFTDYYAEIYPNWGLDGPMPWLLAQLVRDPDQDRETLLDEYYTRYFQEAAAPMRRFFERCEELWMAQAGPPYWLKHYRNESQAVIFAAAASELRELLRAAERLPRSARVGARVRLVSDTFAVTERFLAFHAARERLFRAIATDGNGTSITPALHDYVARRRAFTTYTNTVQERQPHALHPFLWRDFLKNDPAPAALLTLRDLRLPLPPTGDPALDTLRASIPNADSNPAKEVSANPGMTGPLRPPRTIAGLTYGLPQPAGWNTRVEPAQYHRAEFSGPESARVLRLEGTKDTQISQWVKLREPLTFEAAIMVRGRVSPSGSASLVVSYMDASGRNLGATGMRLPDGEWPEWTRLRQWVKPPPTAVWVGYGLRVQYQTKDDWLEARSFSLLARPDASGAKGMKR